MNIENLKHLPQDEIDSLLFGESISHEEASYMRPLSEAELDIKKDQLANNSITKSLLEEELRQIRETYKEKLKTINSSILESLNAIKNKAEITKGKTYRLPDYEKQKIHVVDGKGNVISSRAMLPEERQFRITPAKAM